MCILLFVIYFFTQYFTFQEALLAKGKNSLYDSNSSVERSLRAINEKKVKTTTGTDIEVGCDTICVHSDTPNAVEIITKLKNAIKN